MGEVSKSADLQEQLFLAGHFMSGAIPWFLKAALREYCSQQMDVVLGVMYHL